LSLNGERGDSQAAGGRGSMKKLVAGKGQEGSHLKEVPREGQKEIKGSENTKERPGERMHLNLKKKNEIEKTLQKKLDK